VEGLQLWEKVKKPFISKFLPKGRGTPKKLASKLTIKGPHAPKTLFIDIWGAILEPIHAKVLFYAKISKNQMANDFSFSRRDKNGQFEYLMRIIVTDECPVYLSMHGTCKKWLHLGQKQVKSGTHSKVQVCSKNHSVGRNDSLRCA
jgi:hypothetical protein